MSLPRILVVSLGGTITMTPAATGGIVPTLTADDLVAAAPGLAEVARVEAVSLFGVPGASLILAQLVDVARLLRDRFANGIDGAVVVQGTDTIEETAFVLDLLVGDDKPVVVTGAMRGPQAPGADGPANLLAAACAACDAGLRGCGAVVVLNDEVHAARTVQKSHTALVSAFESPGSGPIGLLSEGRLELLATPRRGVSPVALERVKRPADVALVSLGLGEDGRILSALAGLGYSGAVIEGMGAGHVPRSAVDRVAALTETMPVVLGTRVRAGRVFTRTYGFAGSEMDLIARGVIPCGHLTASKARLQLALLLACGCDIAAIRSAFAERRAPPAV